MDALINYCTLLEELRRDSSEWHRVAFEKTPDADGKWHDTSGITRYGVLRCLQFDLRSEDEALVRFLLCEEVKAQILPSIGDRLWAHTLAVYLLATFRRPPDLPLFWQAKMVNFDTFCGVADYFLFWIGGSNVLADIVTENAEHVEFLRDELTSRPAPTSAELDVWWRVLQKEFPARPEEETSEQRFMAADRLEAEDAAVYWLKHWEEQASASPLYRELQSIAYYWSKRNQFSHAYTLAVRQQTTTAYQNQKAIRLLVHQSIGEYAMKLGRYAEAWEQFNIALESSEVRPATSAQVFCGNFLDLALAAVASQHANNHTIAHHSYEKARSLEKETGFLTRHILRKAEHVALALGDDSSAADYATRATAEEKQTAQQLERIRRGER